MIYTFQGGNQVVQVKAENNQLLMSNITTNYKFTEVYNLIPKAEADKLKNYLAAMDEAEFKEYLIHEFKKMGYTLKNVQNDTTSGTTK